MTLFALGINHKTAPVDLREQVAFTPDSMLDALESLHRINGIDECMIVSTCNRTEIYVVATPPSVDFVLHWLSEFHCVSMKFVAEHIYQLHDDAALRHMMKVASGLDSLVLGEPQILGQVKQAYQLAKQNQTLHKGFERVFQHVFAVAKRVRSETEIGANAVSVAFAAVQLAKQIFSKLEKRSVLLIGAGETIELVAEHLKEAGVLSMSVANRTRDKARALANKLNGEALTLTQLPEHISDYDIVISSTASQLPLVGKGMIGDALKRRKNQPMFLVDLAVPRDIESQVNDIDDAYLYTVDDLQLIVEANLASREEAAEAACVMIEEQLVAYREWKVSQRHGQLVKNYRSSVAEQKNELVERALLQLDDGKSADEVIKELGYKLSNALMHAPTKLLSDASLHQNTNVSEKLADHFNLTLPDANSDTLDSEK
ncbi:glutamyl-tRNA reductase [Alteromonas sp. 5E99-2]|uniref:glutamyl-tRNA reductase n=1 Tax=Alteromonas sp. 5E99-2 TaxID=2817683 RepID=UPI001A9824F8|nr:glutamyl-tRNA reductase [Alteromonas sp. 5E99-2]MBO1255492.1 glutamyl-tRNA reductase [Alteromonas sp. 5E99-2]